MDAMYILGGCHVCTYSGDAMCVHAQGDMVEPGLRILAKLRRRKSFEGLLQLVKVACLLAKPMALRDCVVDVSVADAHVTEAGGRQPPGDVRTVASIAFHPVLCFQATRLLDQTNTIRR